MLHLTEREADLAGRVSQTHLPAAEVRRVPSARHAQRATFLTLLEADGANMAIARRATHRAPTDVVGGYIRSTWAQVCDEISKLALALPPRGAATFSATSVSSGSEAPEKQAWNMGVAGLEPATSTV